MHLFIINVSKPLIRNKTYNLLLNCLIYFIILSTIRSSYEFHFLSHVILYHTILRHIQIIQNKVKENEINQDNVK